MSTTLSRGLSIPRIVSETKVAAVTPQKKTIPFAKQVVARSQSKAPSRSLATPRVFKKLRLWSRLRSFVNIFSLANMLPFASLAVVMMIVSLVSVHLVTVNAYSGKGFELKRHQATINSLKEQQKRLVVQQAEMGSITKVNDAAIAYGLVPIANEEFLTTNKLTQR